MIRYKWFFDFAKEEQWLTKMAADGFAVTAVNGYGRYTFQNCKPSKFDYRIDYRRFRKNEDFLDYCTLFEDSGWKHIGGTKSSGTQYFVKVLPGASADIFSDTASRSGRYKRLSEMWLHLFIAFLPIAVALFMTGEINPLAFVNPRALYYTPHLWSRTGVDFWRAFLFETPFAVGRGYLWLFIPVCLLLYFYFFYRAYALYRRNIKNTRT